MRRLVLPAVTAALLLTAACAPTAREVALPLAPPTPTILALDGYTSFGELADARRALDALEAEEARPDLVAVAREGFSCWEDSVVTAPRLSPEAEACRADFWGAVYALSDPREVAAR